MASSMPGSQSITRRVGAMPRLYLGPSMNDRSDPAPARDRFAAAARGLPRRQLPRPAAARRPRRHRAPRRRVGGARGRGLVGGRLARRRRRAAGAARAHRRRAPGRGRGDELAERQPAPAAGRAVPADAPTGSASSSTPTHSRPTRTWSPATSRGTASTRPTPSGATAGAIDETVAVVLLAGVSYLTGAAADIAAVTAAAHDAGALVVLDLAHAAGNVPLDLHAWRRRRGRVVLLQVPQRRAGRARRDLRQRAPPRRAAAGRLVGRRPRRAVPDGGRLRRRPGRRGLRAVDPAGARPGAARRVAGAVRRGRLRRRCASGRCG